MITENRKKHIWAVAEFLKNFATEQNMKSEDCEALYTLGMLHDIGYEFLEEKDYLTHNIVGGNLLKNLGYKYWKEVYYHGIPNSPYQSYFLDLLNWADARTDGTGNTVSFEEGLLDISRRYNIPVEKLEYLKLVEELKDKGFK